MDKMEILWIALGVMNVALYILMGADKLNAKMDRRRVPEKVLFAFAVLGGGLGGTLGMYSFRHKTRHWYFAVFFPLLAVLQIAGIAWLLIK